MARALNVFEEKFLRQYFGDSLKTPRIRIMATPVPRAHSVYGNYIGLPTWCFLCGDSAAEVDLANTYAAATFAHEAVHVWQRQQGLWVTWKGLWLQLGYGLGIDPYVYDCSEHDPDVLLEYFRSGNIEQQGQIVEDLVVAERTGQHIEKFRAVREYLHSLAHRALSSDTDFRRVTLARECECEDRGKGSRSAPARESPPG
ncbi:MAG: hypothetical protein AB7G75_14010 [Candidatus Binatia bacterium]